MLLFMRINRTVHPSRPHNESRFKELLMSHKNWLADAALSVNDRVKKWDDWEKSSDLRRSEELLRRNGCFDLQTFRRDNNESGRT